MSKNHLSIYTLNAISAVLTGLGYFTFLQPVMERALGTEIGVWAAAAVGLGGSLAVQGLVHGLWSRLGHEGRLLSSTLPAAIVASVFSWTGAAAGLLLIGNEATLLFERQQAQASATAAPLQSFADSFARLQADLRGAADDARQKADAETRGRPTCTNDQKTGAFCGERCRFRTTQADELATMNQLLGGTVQQARELAKAMTLAETADQQREVYAKALDLRGNDIQPEVAARLQSLAAQFGASLRDPQSQKEFVCEDAAFASRLRTLAEDVESRASLPDVPPTAQRVDMSDTMNCIVQRVGELAGLGQPCSRAIGDGALLGALAIEFMLAFLLLHELAHARRYGALPTQSEMARKMQARDHTGSEPEVDAWLLSAAARHVIDAPPQGRFIAVPVDGSEQARIDGERLVRMLRAGRPAYFNVPLDLTDRDWVQARAFEFGHATRFHLHRWPAWGDVHLERASNRARPDADARAAA